MLLVAANAVAHIATPPDWKQSSQSQSSEKPARSAPPSVIRERLGSSSGRTTMPSSIPASIAAAETAAPLQASRGGARALPGGVGDPVAPPEPCADPRASRGARRTGGSFRGSQWRCARRGRLDHQHRAAGLVRDRVRDAAEHAPLHAAVADHEQVRAVASRPARPARRAGSPSRAAVRHVIQRCSAQCLYHRRPAPPRRARLRACSTRGLAAPAAPRPPPSRPRPRPTAGCCRRSGRPARLHAERRGLSRTRPPCQPSRSRRFRRR